MLIELDGKGALYLQLYRALKQRILAGVLREGERLPASRTLARSSVFPGMWYCSAMRSWHRRAILRAGSVPAPGLPSTA